VFGKVVVVVVAEEVLGFAEIEMVVH